eukprot:gene7715-7914_t
MAGASSTCAVPDFANGVIAEPINQVTWRGCLSDSNKTGLALFGERCGAKMDKFRWTGIMAYSQSTNQLYKNCVRLRAAETDARRVATFFGDCGVAPTLFPAAPTSVCLEVKGTPCIPASSISSYTIQLTNSYCGSSRAVFTGSGCGPKSALIQWQSFVPGDSCSSVSRDDTPGDLKKQADWLGQCGVPPHQVQGVPTAVCERLPVDDNSSSFPPPLPAQALAFGESRSLWNMQRVGAYDSTTGTVPDAAAAIAASGYRVATVDTGADPSHPDLNVVEFNDLVDYPGSTYYNRDGNGHGRGWLQASPESRLSP